MSSVTSRKEATATSGYGDSTPERQQRQHLPYYGYEFVFFVAVGWYLALCSIPAFLYIDGWSPSVYNAFATAIVLPISACALSVEFAGPCYGNHENSRLVVMTKYAVLFISITTLLLIAVHVLLFLLTSLAPVPLLLLSSSLGVVISCSFLRPAEEVLGEFVERVFLDGAFVALIAFNVHLGLVFVPVLYSALSAIHACNYIML